jgi:hypothetical protein
VVSQRSTLKISVVLWSFFCYFFAAYCPFSRLAWSCLLFLLLSPSSFSLPLAPSTGSERRQSISDCDIYVIFDFYQTTSRLLRTKAVAPFAQSLFAYINAYLDHKGGASEVYRNIRRKHLKESAVSRRLHQAQRDRPIP